MIAWLRQGLQLLLLFLATPLPLAAFTRGCGDSTNFNGVEAAEKVPLALHAIMHALPSCSSAIRECLEKELFFSLWSIRGIYLQPYLIRVSCTVKARKKAWQKTSEYSLTKGTKAWWWDVNTSKHCFLCFFFQIWTPAKYTLYSSDTGRRTNYCSHLLALVAEPTTEYFALKANCATNALVVVVVSLKL